MFGASLTRVPFFSRKPKDTLVDQITEFLFNPISETYSSVVDTACCVRDCAGAGSGKVTKGLSKKGKTKRTLVSSRRRGGGGGKVV